MSALRIPALAAAALCVTALAPAQVAVGSAAPSFDFQASYNDAPASFADFKGKLVMIEFFATW